MPRLFRRQSDPPKGGHKNTYNSLSIHDKVVAGRNMDPSDPPKDASGTPSEAPGTSQGASGSPGCHRQGNFIMYTTRNKQFRRPDSSACCHCQGHVIIYTAYIKPTRSLSVTHPKEPPRFQGSSGPASGSIFKVVLYAPKHPETNLEDQPGPAEYAKRLHMYIYMLT